MLADLIARKNKAIAAIVTVVVALLSTSSMAQDLPPIDSTTRTIDVDSADAEGYQELTRGPIHEAFAEQVSLEAEPGMIVPKAPPEPIDEIVPENRPANENAIWIGGYWAYDDIERDFLWVSGVWRVPPFESEWVPGYWTKVEKGYQWIGGFWVSTDREQLSYLPPPPKSLEEGPTSAAPSDQHFWLPGCWYYQDNDYKWRAGYWVEVRDDYAWVPNYYRATPRGYVLCGGYWDYSLASRGYLFAPVQFTSPVYTQRAFHYRPRVVLDLAPLHFHLFVRPSYSHYYFGDYYGDRYHNHGFYAWHRYATQRHAYDPIFAYNVSLYRGRGVDFAVRIGKWHNWFNEHEDYRPRHTWRAQREFQRQRGDWDQLASVTLGESFDQVVQQERDSFVERDQRRQAREDGIRERIERMRQQRQQVEAGDRTAQGEEGVVTSDGDEGRRPQLRLREGRDGDARTGQEGRDDVTRPRRDEDRPRRSDDDGQPRTPDSPRPDADPRPNRDDDATDDPRQPQTPRTDGEDPRTPSTPQPDRPDVPRDGDQPDQPRQPETPDRPETPPTTTPERPETPSTQPETPATQPERPSTRPETPEVSPGGDSANDARRSALERLEAARRASQEGPSGYRDDRRPDASRLPDRIRRSADDARRDGEEIRRRFGSQREMPAAPSERGDIRERQLPSGQRPDVQRPNIRRPDVQRPQIRPQQPSGQPGSDASGGRGISPGPAAQPNRPSGQSQPPAARPQRGGGSPAASGGPSRGGGAPQPSAQGGQQGGGGGGGGNAAGGSDD